MAVTQPSNTQQGLTAVEMVHRSPKEFRLPVEDITLDSGYAAGEVVSGFKKLEINAYIAERANVIRVAEGIFLREEFIYNKQKDCFVCPGQKELKRQGRYDKRIKYAARKKDCANCPLKSNCTKALYRTINVNIYETGLNWASDLRNTGKYKVKQQKRKQIEQIFGEAKELMGLRRPRRRGRQKVLEQCYMTALTQNIKRIVKAYYKPKKTAIMPLEAAKSSVIRSLQTLLLDQINDFWSRKFRFLSLNFGF